MKKCCFVCIAKFDTSPVYEMQYEWAPNILTYERLLSMWNVKESFTSCNMIFLVYCKIWHEPCACGATWTSPRYSETERLLFMWNMKETFILCNMIFHVYYEIWHEPCACDATWTNPVYSEIGKSSVHMKHERVFYITQHNFFGILWNLTRSLRMWCNMNEPHRFWNMKEFCAHKTWKSPFIMQHEFWIPKEYCILLFHRKATVFWTYCTFWVLYSTLSWFEAY